MPGKKGDRGKSLLTGGAGLTADRIVNRRRSNRMALEAARRAMGAGNKTKRDNQSSDTNQ